MGPFILLKPLTSFTNLWLLALFIRVRPLVCFISSELPMMTIMLLVFPGGIIPTLSLLIDTLSSGSKGRLVIDSVNNIGPHYARTLREWRRRFLDRFDDVIVPALRAEYPLVMGNVNGDQGQNEIEIFKRKWLCECLGIGRLLLLIRFC